MHSRVAGRIVVAMETTSRSIHSGWCSSMRMIEMTLLLAGAGLCQVPRPAEAP